MRVIRHFSVARQSNQQLFALNQAEKLSVTTRRYDLSGGKHHVCKIKETPSFFPDSPDCPVICWCSTSPSWLLQEKIRTKEWVENSWTGNSKLSFKHCVSLVPCLCSEGSVTQVSATRGWEVNRMLYSLSMNQLKKKISYLVGKTKSSISQCMAGLEANLIAFWGWQWVTRGGMAISLLLVKGGNCFRDLSGWRKCP